MSAAALAATAACQMAPPPSASEEGTLFRLGFRGLPVERKVVSYREQRYEHVVRQELDYSCGAAALATLLQFYYLDETQEREIIESMILAGDTDRIKLEGFSLLDLAKFSERRGYQARGFKLEPDMLERMAIPAITLVNTRGYGHFVVLKGARDGVVYLADPALGHRKMGIVEFEKEWTGAVLFVAAARDKSIFAPLDELEGGNSVGPADLVRSLDHLGLRNVVVRFPNEF